MQCAAPRFRRVTCAGPAVPVAGRSHRQGALTRLRRYRDDFHDVYHITEMMDCDLHRINYSQKLTDDHVH